MSATATTKPRYIVTCRSVNELRDALDLIESDATAGEDELVRIFGRLGADTMALVDWRRLLVDLVNGAGNWSRWNRRSATIADGDRAAREGQG